MGIKLSELDINCTGIAPQDYVNKVLPHKVIPKARHLNYCIALQPTIKRPELNRFLCHFE